MARPRLSARFSGSWESALTLVSGPAGFGKTTLLTEWSSLSAAEGRTAWVSLDQRDNEAATLWSHVDASHEPDRCGCALATSGSGSRATPRPAKVRELARGQPNTPLQVLEFVGRHG